MNNFDHLQHLLATRLGGDKSRMAELFDDEVLFVRLQASVQASDWHRFRAGTSDGVYLVEEDACYAVHEQDRGVVSHRHTFESLDAAAGHFFHKYW